MEKFGCDSSCWDNKSVTPQEFINAIQNIKIQTPIDLSIIKNSFKNLFAEFQIPYKIRDSKSRNNSFYIHYMCRFNDCSSFFKCIIQGDQISISSFNWTHSHSLNNIFVSANYCLLNTNIIEEIKQLRSDGATPGFIRSKFNLSISPNQLYNISRKEINNRFQNEIKKLHEKAETWNMEFFVIFHEDEINFEGITLINKRIIRLPFASDIAIIDDTMCTNKYRFPILPCYCIDDHNEAQILAIGVIPDKTTLSFEQYLKDLRQHTNIRVFICDRLESQKIAIQKFFPDAFIAFCRIHIKRNIKNKIGANSEIYISLKKLFKEDISVEEFVQLIDNEIILHEKWKKQLSLLKEHLPHFNPYILKNLRLRNHYTSNMAEGIFGRVKDWINHDITPLCELLDCFVRESRMMIQKNIRTKVEPLPIELYQGPSLGSIATTFLKRSYLYANALMKTISTSENPEIRDGFLKILEEQNCKCIERREFMLPCIHDIFAKIKLGLNPLLNENDIPSIYFRCGMENIQQSQITIEKPCNKINCQFTYRNIMDLVSPIASEAEHNKDVQNLFKSLFDGYEGLKQKSFEGSPSFLPKPGRPLTKQSKIVPKYRGRSGKEKIKKMFKCSICNGKGHNAATCPFKNRK